MSPASSSGSAYQRRIDSFIRRHFPGVDAGTARNNREVMRAARGHISESPQTAEGAVLLAVAGLRNPERYSEALSRSEEAKVAMRSVISSRPDLFEAALRQAERRGSKGELDISGGFIERHFPGVSADIGEQPLFVVVDVGATLASSAETTTRPMRFDTPAEALAYYSVVPVRVVLIPNREPDGSYTYGVRIAISSK